MLVERRALERLQTLNTLKHPQLAALRRRNWTKSGLDARFVHAALDGVVVLDGRLVKGAILIDLRQLVILLRRRLLIEGVGGVQVAFLLNVVLDIITVEESHVRPRIFFEALIGDILTQLLALLEKPLAKASLFDRLVTMRLLQVARILSHGGDLKLAPLLLLLFGGTLGLGEAAEWSQTSLLLCIQWRDHSLTEMLRNREFKIGTRCAKWCQLELIITLQLFSCLDSLDLLLLHFFEHGKLR